MARRTRSRITVVDDSPEFLGMLVELLGEDGDGYQVTAIDGELESFEDIVRTKPNLLIVDLVLRNAGTHMSGWELVLLGRFHPGLREVPLIVCSGDALQLEERADQLAELANLHILTKPFSVEQLEGLVARLLRERVPRHPRRLRRSSARCMLYPSSDAGRGAPTNAPGGSGRRATSKAHLRGGRRGVLGDDCCAGPNGCAG